MSDGPAKRRYLNSVEDYLEVFIAAVNEVGENFVAEIRSRDRMRQALLWIGPECATYTSGNCRDSGRTPDAEYGDDRWCDGCIAAYGLG
jgi:hypothetical protein